MGIPTETSQGELDRLFALQKEAFLGDSMPSLESRLDRLKRLEAAMVKHRKEFQEALRADFGAHSAIVTDLFETGGVLGRNRYIQLQLSEWMGVSPRTLNPAAHGSSTTTATKYICTPWGDPQWWVTTPRNATPSAISSGVRASVTITKSWK